MKQQTASKEQANHQHEDNYRLARRTFWAICVYSLLTAGIFVAGIVANRISNANLVDANRAWLAPTAFLFLKPVDDLDGPVVEVHYQNVGRLPALDLNATGGLSLARLSAPTVIGWNTFPILADKGGWDVVEANMRQGCEKNEPVGDKQTIFPSIATDSIMIAGTETVPGAKAEHKNVVDKNSIYLVVGCFAYRSFDETRRTGFCRYISKHRSGAWEILNCPAGNFAY